MIPAKLANRIYNFIYLPQRHPIHLLVELVEITFSLRTVSKSLYTNYKST